jgi:hypothetical protein
MICCNESELRTALLATKVVNANDRFGIDNHNAYNPEPENLVKALCKLEEYGMHIMKFSEAKNGSLSFVTFCTDPQSVRKYEEDVFGVKGGFPKHVISVDWL